MKNFGTVTYALPLSAIQQLTEGDNAKQQIVQEFGVQVGVNDMRTLLEMKNKQEFILYSGYTPQNGDNSHNFFENQGVWATPQWTNIKNAGLLPFSGRFKVLGIGMLCNVIDPVEADLNRILDGYFVAKFGSVEGVYMQSNLWLTYTQPTSCCMTDASPGHASRKNILSSSPFKGRNGYLALPNGPVIKSSQQFLIEVHWNNAWAAESNVSMYWYMFGKRLIPLSDEATR